MSTAEPASQLPNASGALDGQEPRCPTPNDALVIFARTRMWVVPCADVRFMLHETEPGLWEAKDDNGAMVGIRLAPFTEQMIAVTDWWNDMGRGRGLYYRALEKIEGQYDTRHPFRIYMDGRWHGKDYLTPSKNDHLIVENVSNHQVRCVPLSALRCYLEPINERWQAVDVVTRQNIPGTPTSREGAIRIASEWARKRSDAEIRMVLELDFMAWREGQKDV